MRVPGIERKRVRPANVFHSSNRMCLSLPRRHSLSLSLSSIVDQPFRKQSTTPPYPLPLRHAAHTLQPNFPFSLLHHPCVSPHNDVFSLLTIFIAHLLLYVLHKGCTYYTSHFVLNALYDRLLVFFFYFTFRRRKAKIGSIAESTRYCPRGALDNSLI